MKKGFTLAEVLITLAVIGVVAALTIPVLVSKYQKNQLYSQFMKAYNIVNNVVDFATIENGEVSSWDWDNENPAQEYIVPKLKTIKVCDNTTDCLASNIKKIGGSDFTLEENSEGPQRTTVVLADGLVISILKKENTVDFTVDTNGKKSPNVVGRDVFNIHYQLVTDNEHRVGIYLDEYADGNCNPDSSSSTGEGCASRLIQEGKMSY